MLDTSEVAGAVVDLTVRDHLAVMRLNRPETYNALDLTLADALVAALIRCDEDPAVRAVLITGNGPAFCSGGDIRQMQEHSDRGESPAPYLKALTSRLHVAIATLSHMPKPVVTGINGAAAGAGFGLALAGDLVVASERASFTAGYTAIGLTPDGGLSYYLTRILGPKLALQLVYSNRKLSATEALGFGMVSQIFPAASFDADAQRYARALADGPVALGVAKRLILTAGWQSLETQMEYERQAIAACSRTADAREGIAAFLGKRPARFGSSTPSVAET